MDDVADGDPALPTQWQRIEHHTRTLDRAVRMTQLADAKVAPVLALHASLAAVTVSQSASLGAVLTADGFSPGRAAATWVCLLLYVVASLLAFRQVSMVYIPTAPTRGRRTFFGHSLFYFDDIQHMEFDEYAMLSRGISKDVLEEDVLHQSHIVCAVASRKLAGVQQAYVLSAMTLGAWLPLIVLSRI